jgi:sensor histidine kinase regulating citrate/malate metabolism
MVGGDNARALEGGEAYISKAVGTLGPSMRGKVPVFDDSDKVIGVVSVGYLQETVEGVTADYLQRILLWVFILFLLGGLGTWLIARDIKMSIFGLEPAEIATLFRERNAILDSIREGVVAINDEGRITMLDHEAAKILDIPPESGIGTPIELILPQTRMLEVLESGEEQFDQEMMIGDIVLHRFPRLRAFLSAVKSIQSGCRCLIQAGYPKSWLLRDRAWLFDLRRLSQPHLHGLNLGSHYVP